MTSKTIAEVLKQDTIELKAEDYLISYTHADGYTNTHTGQYVFKLEDNPNGTGLQVSPVTTAVGGKEYEVETGAPIIVQEGAEVTYVYNTLNEAYQGTKFKVETAEVGKENNFILLAFLKFAEDNFSLGVNDFVVASADFFESEVAAPPEPEPEPEP